MKSAIDVPILYLRAYNIEKVAVVFVSLHPYYSFIIPVKLDSTERR